MDDMGMAGEAGMAQDQGQGQDQGGYEICIKVDAQGQISVGVESDASPGAMAEPQDEGADYTPAQSIDEALQVAKSIFDNDGQMGDAGNDRETIAKQVFGDMAQPQAPGQLNRKSSLKGGY